MKALWIEVLLAKHVVDVHPGAGHDDARAGPVRAGDRGAVAVGVQNREVGGRARAIRRIVGAAGPAVAPHPLPFADPDATASRSAARKRSTYSSSCSPTWKSFERRALAASVAATISSTPLLFPSRSSRPSEYRDQDPSRGRRRVGEHVIAAEPGVHRAALDRLVGGHIVHPEGPAALPHPVADCPCDLSAVEGLGALGREALQRIRHLRIAEDVRPPPAACPRGCRGLPTPASRSGSGGGSRGSTRRPSSA